MLKQKYEFFNGQKWEEFESPFRGEVDKTRFRFTSENEHYIKEDYILGIRYHNLDGPARLAIEKYDGRIYCQEWHIHGLWLYQFENFYDKNNPQKAVFNYIQSDEIKLLLVLKGNPFLSLKLLIRHNNWLTEEQLSLVDSLKLFL